LISNNLKFFKIKFKSLSLSSDEKRYENPQTKIPVNKAGGGLVYNKRRVYSFSGTENGFTKGRNRKGKISKVHQCASRRGNGCQSTPNYKKLKKTYHVFKRNGVYKLKLHTGSKCFLILREHLKGNLRKESKSSLGTSKDIPGCLKTSYEHQITI
jgi:hypothetical protein